VARAALFTHFVARSTRSRWTADELADEAGGK
jgi:hypothetical protein